MDTKQTEIETVTQIATQVEALLRSLPSGYHVYPHGDRLRIIEASAFIEGVQALEGAKTNLGGKPMCEMVEIIERETGAQPVVGAIEYLWKKLHGR